MSVNKPNSNDRKQVNAWPKLVLRPADQGTAAAILVLALVVLAAHWGYQHWRRGRLIEIDRAETRLVQFQIDINEADWPEFCLLPGVGEVLAQRIVEYRREHGPFQDLESLRNVRGVGPKTFNSIRPYLMPLADLEATAEQTSEPPPGSS